ncbi:hypothetical protein ATANTOWER_030901 [Ataeniobius toweri]|uniref:Uncharacterized protein n=1 Tax=Ataeniobius toweri TaxID=208326 RepID=A0ABU7B2W9_9TELE|nr:hypothetical protein [Ataeniobius toweri]
MEKSAAERAKRRHARPSQLDSDDEEEEDLTHNNKHHMSDQVEAIVPLLGDSHILSDRDDGDDADQRCEEKTSAQEMFEGEDAIACQTSAEEQWVESVAERLSESIASEESNYSWDSFPSESFDDSSSDLSSRHEGMEEEDADDRSEECIVISSDEDLMELELSVTPTAPLTPGAQLDLDWLESCHRAQTGENCPACLHENSDVDSMVELQHCDSPDLELISPIELEVVSGLGVSMGRPEWTPECVENIDNLRPLTPTGSLVDSDTDNLIKSKPASPSLDEVERPATPGKGIIAELFNIDSDEANEIISLSPPSGDVLLPTSDFPPASYPSYEEKPKTPGRDETGVWTLHSSTIATNGQRTATFQGSTVFSPLHSPPDVLPLSSNPYISPPKTPGRDIFLPRRDIVHKRKTKKIPTSLPLLHDSPLSVSPLPISFPCSLFESSFDSADGNNISISSGVRMKPLQGLENMPRLYNEEKPLSRQKLWRRLKRRKRASLRQRLIKGINWSCSFQHHLLRRRSSCEEYNILHNIWKEGLDEEDARHLQSTYERLLEQNNVAWWLSDTFWIPHPHILFILCWIMHAL